MDIFEFERWLFWDIGEYHGQSHTGLIKDEIGELYFTAPCLRLRLSILDDCHAR
jgi:hypothetical protein